MYLHIYKQQNWFREKKRKIFVIQTTKLLSSKEHVILRKTDLKRPVYVTTFFWITYICFDTLLYY